nr:odorant receptor 47a-like [Nomia melanderi]
MKYNNNRNVFTLKCMLHDVLVHLYTLRNEFNINMQEFERNGREFVEQIIGFKVSYIFHVKDQFHGRKSRINNSPIQEQILKIRRCNGEYEVTDRYHQVTPLEKNNTNQVNKHQNCNDIFLDLKYAIGWNLFNLNLVGIWPEPTKSNNCAANFRAIVSVSCLFFFIVIWQSINLFLLGGDFEQITQTLTMANIPTFNAAIKLLVLLYCRKDLQPLVKSFYDDWYTLKTKEDRTTMLNSANLSRFLSIWCSVLTAIMVSSYIFLRSFLICRYNITAEPQYRLSIYPAYYPFDMRPTLVRVIVNVAQVFGAYCGAVPYTGVDNFIAMLVLHICGQFQNLKRKLTRLMDGQRKPKEIQVELAWIVQRHEHLNWAASRIEDCFNQLLLWQLLLCTIEICFQGFSILIAYIDSRLQVLFVSETGISAFQTIFFTLFILFVIVHVYLYCYVGELLRVHSSSMAIAAYESNWYNVAPSEAKCLLFIMLRSTRPLRLTAGKFSTFSMEMFNTILRTAMGYLSVLLTVSSNLD